MIQSLAREIHPLQIAHADLAFRQSVVLTNRTAEDYTAAKGELSSGSLRIFYICSIGYWSTRVNTPVFPLNHRVSVLKGSREHLWQTRYYDFNVFTTRKFIKGPLMNYGSCAV
jgi:hypothetical protein